MVNLKDYQITRHNTKGIPRNNSIYTFGVNQWDYTPTWLGDLREVSLPRLIFSCLKHPVVPCSLLRGAMGQCSSGCLYFTMFLIMGSKIFFWIFSCFTDFVIVFYLVFKFYLLIFLTQRKEQLVERPHVNKARWYFWQLHGVSVSTSSVNNEYGYSLKFDCLNVYCTVIIKREKV